MKSVGFHAFGGVDELQMITRPMPVAGPDQVVVKVAAAAINPTDLMMLSGAQAGMMTALHPPYVSGMEFSGHIHALGAGVDLPLGQAVMGLVNPRRPEGGSHSDYVVVPAASIVPVPEGADLIAAAAIPMNGVTALMALELTRLTAGAHLLVTGGTGILGGMILRLARLKGIIVWAGGRPEEADLLRDLGASHVLPRDSADLLAALAQARPQGVDAMIDTALIGAGLTRAVADGGRSVSVRLSAPIADPRLENLYVGIVNGMQRQDLLAELAALLARGEIAPRIAPNGIWPMTEMRAAFTAAQTSGKGGRNLLRFNQD